MAEAAGLALGGVALFATFNSCIEFLDLLEQGKNCTRDVQIASTKLRLIKRRLADWGQSISIDDWKCHETPPACSVPWLNEGSLIFDSLLGIKRLLANTSELCQRYDYRQCMYATLPRNRTRRPESVPGGRQGHRHDHLASGDCGSQSRVAAGKSRESTGSGQPLLSDSVPSPWEKSLTTTSIWALKLFRLKFSWAVQGKKQFEGLIADLDFLVSNLEKIRDGMHCEVGDGRAIHLQRAESDPTQGLSCASTAVDESETISNGSVFNDLVDRGVGTMHAYSSSQVREPASAPASEGITDVVRAPRPTESANAEARSRSHGQGYGQAYGPGTEAPRQGAHQQGAHPHDADRAAGSGNVYAYGSASTENATLLQGHLGRNTPAQGNVTTRNTNARDDSLLANGFVSDETVAQILKARAAQPNSSHSSKSNNTSKKKTPKQ